MSITKFLSGLFGGRQEDAAPASEAAARPSGTTTAVSGPKTVTDLIGFVDYVVRALVDNPTAVKVNLEEAEGRRVIAIRCEKADIGKIIGKNGKTIMAIRQLVTGAASRANEQINVEVID